MIKGRKPTNIPQTPYLFPPPAFSGLLWGLPIGFEVRNFAAAAVRNASKLLFEIGMGRAIFANLVNHGGAWVGERMSELCVVAREGGNNCASDGVSE